MTTWSDSGYKVLSSGKGWDDDDRYWKRDSVAFGTCQSNRKSPIFLWGC